MPETSNYTEENIKSLDWREHIRLRPGMYIGKSGDGSSPDDGIYLLLKETIDNSIDEFLMGFGIIVIFNLLVGIITPPVPSIEEFYKFKDRINERNKKMDIISTIFIPSEKNVKALKLIKFDWSEYQNNLYEFTKEVFNNSNGVLISSPNDFQEGLKLIRRMRTSV